MKPIFEAICYVTNFVMSNNITPIAGMGHTHYWPQQITSPTIHLEFIPIKTQYGFHLPSGKVKITIREVEINEHE